MKLIIICLVVFIGSVAPAFGAYTLKSGKLINTDEVATLSVQEHYSAALEAFQKNDWTEVARQATIVIRNFPETPFYQEALYLLGAAMYNVGEYEISNKHLSSYLRKQAALQHFREAIDLKFRIAEQFKDGAKKHMMGWKALPKWVPAYDEALKIYDEVISALPNDDLAARALFGKSFLQLAEEEYASSIETCQTLIRRFPKHELAPEAYVQVAHIYLTESQEKYPDADYLDLAEINMKRFRADFPSDDRLLTVEKIFEEMQEVYANSFYEIGQFFERTKKPHAAVIYYAKIVKTFPNTHSAELSRSRLKTLRPSAEKQTGPAEALASPIPEPAP